MKLSKMLRLITPVAAIIVLTMTLSCTSVKKYGCPNHLQLFSFVGR